MENRTFEGENLEMGDVHTHVLLPDVYILLYSCNSNPKMTPCLRSQTLRDLWFHPVALPPWKARTHSLVQQKYDEIHHWGSMNRTHSSCNCYQIHCDVLNKLLVFVSQHPEKEHGRKTKTCDKPVHQVLPHVSVALILRLPPWRAKRREHVDPTVQLDGYYPNSWLLQHVGGLASVIWCHLSLAEKIWQVEVVLGWSLARIKVLAEQIYCVDAVFALRFWAAAEGPITQRFSKPFPQRNHKTDRTGWVVPAMAWRPNRSQSFCNLRLDLQNAAVSIAVGSPTWENGEESSDPKSKR